jgi:phosphoadenosine phosphosulfate reductase
VEVIVAERVLSRWTPTELAALNAQFQAQPPAALLDWATAQFGASIVLTCSFGGASGMVLLDMVARLGRGTPVVFLDTGLLFGETYALAEQVAHHYGLAVEHQRPSLSLAEQERREGPELYHRDPDRCCQLRKVAPLAAALRPYAAWISGVRRDQGSTRAQTELVQWNARYDVLKFNPLAYWSERDVWAYIHRYDVPYNPLLDQGYRSIGCRPCTSIASGDDPRAGRWNGFAKVECGIHL